MMKRFKVVVKHPFQDKYMVLETTPVDSWVNLEGCEEVSVAGNKFVKIANLFLHADSILWIETIPYDDEKECDLEIRTKMDEFTFEEEF